MAGGVFRPPWRYPTGYQVKSIFGKQPDNIILIGDAGSLTLTGRDAALVLLTNMPGVKGDLTLTGQTATFPVVTATIKGDLSLVGRNAVLFTTSYVNSSDLLLHGRDATFAFEQATAKGDLTLTGYGASLATTLDTVNGALTLSGQHATLTPSGETIEGNLTLTGRDAFLRVIEIMPTIKGDLVLTGFDAAFVVTEPGGLATLLLTGRAATLTPTMLTTHGRLVLTPNDAELKSIGGGTSSSAAGDGDRPRRRKNRASPGFDQIAKDPARDKIRIERKPLVPPLDLSGEGTPFSPETASPPQFNEVDLDSVLAMRAEIVTAQDLADINRLLVGMDLDEQDVADVLDILALID